MNISPDIDMTVIEVGTYTARELRIILSRHRQKPVPSRTLRWWRNQIGIVPTEQNTYDDRDLQILIRLVRWISRGGTIASFKSLLKKEIEQCHSMKAS